MTMAGDFLRTKREREDQLNNGIRKSLRGEAVTNDLSPHRDEWSPHKIKEKQQERERIEAERESGAWPM